MKNIIELRLTNVNDEDLFNLIKNRCRKSDPRFDYYFEDKDKSIPPALIESYESPEVITWRIIGKKDHKEIGEFNRMCFVGNIILRFIESSSEDNERVHDIFEDFRKELNFLGYKVETSPIYIDHWVRDAKGRRIYVPKRCKDLNRWKAAYKLMKKMDEDYDLLFKDEATGNPLPTLGEYSQNLASGMKWKPSEKTISRIIKAGKAGLLD